VSGAWLRGKPKAVKMFKVVNGSLSEVASSPLDAQGAFSMSFTPEAAGYFVLGLSPSNIQNRYNFYLKPGDALQLTVEENSYRLDGNRNSRENVEMARWHDFLFPLEDKSIYYQGKNSTYVDFFPLLEEKLAAAGKYKAARTKDKDFDATFADFRRYDLLYNALYFIYSVRTAHPQDEDFIDYYRHIDIPALTRTTELLRYPGGLSLLMNSYMTEIRLNASLTPEQKKEYQNNPAPRLLGGADAGLIANDTIKGEIALMFGRYSKTIEGFEKFKEAYSKYIITPSQQERWSHIEAGIHRSMEQKELVDFKFPDVNGTDVSLSDFRGKVVYIDIWATWCGPCKREMPFMKKLEAEYADNKDIVFMGISIDVSKDIQKWKNFLEKEQLPGVQLFAGDMAGIALSKPYKITGIPRFMLVGKDGRFVYMDAPRPSSAEIRSILNAALKK
jgi:thiol-disulfide isomerase/thioredoxin